MRTHPVGHRLDQVGALTVARPIGSSPHRRKHGQDIVAIDPDAGKAVALGTLRDGSRRLLRKRDGNRPVIVLAEEDHGCLEDAGHVQRFMPVALGRGAIAEGHQRNIVAVLQPRAHGETDRVWHLARHRDGQRCKGIFAWVPWPV